VFIHWLVVSTPLKNKKVSWDDENPNVPAQGPSIIKIELFFLGLRRTRVRALKEVFWRARARREPTTKILKV